MNFEFRMLGLDSVWRNTKSREISFYNLNPGHYQFEVKAINVNGIKSKQAAVYQFFISKPFWKTTWFYLLLFFSILGIIAFIMKLIMKHALKKEKEKSRIQQLVSDSQLKALQSQMNPHFIFNAINSIQAYILNNEKQIAYDYLAKFSSLIRKILFLSNQKTVLVKTEVETLELYIQLEQKRLKNKFDYQIEIDEELYDEEVQVPTLILQPFVENSIWHGLMNLNDSRKGLLRITGRMEDGELIVGVIDNGIGRGKAAEYQKPNHDSMGINLIKDRLHVLGSDVQINYIDLLDSNQQPVGTEVEIRFKL